MTVTLNGVKIACVKEKKKRKKAFTSTIIDLGCNTHISSKNLLQQYKATLKKMHNIYHTNNTLTQKTIRKKYM